MTKDYLHKPCDLLNESKLKPEVWLATPYGQQAQEKYAEMFQGKDLSLLSGIDAPSEELVQIRDRYNNFRAYAGLAQSIIKQVHPTVPYRPVGGDEIAGHSLSLESGFRVLTHPGRFNYPCDRAISELTAADRQIVQLFSIARAEYHMALDADPDSPNVGVLKFCHEVLLPAMQKLIPALKEDAITLDRLAKSGRGEAAEAPAAFAKVDQVQANVARPTPPKAQTPQLEGMGKVESAIVAHVTDTAKPVEVDPLAPPTHVREIIDKQEKGVRGVRGTVVDLSAHRKGGGRSGGSS